MPDYVIPIIETKYTTITICKANGLPGFNNNFIFPYSKFKKALIYLLKTDKMGSVA